MKTVDILRQTPLGRAAIFFGFSVAICFLVVVFGVLKAQENEFKHYTEKSNAISELKEAYEGYEANFLQILARGNIVSPAVLEQDFVKLISDLNVAENLFLDARDNGVFKNFRIRFNEITPEKLQPTIDVSAVALAFWQMNEQFYELEAEQAKQDQIMQDGIGMHHAAQFLMVVSALVLFLLLGRIFMTQTTVMSLLQNEKAKSDRTRQLQLAAMEAAHEGIMILDALGTILFMNRAFSLLHFLSGPGRKEAIGKNWGDLYDAAGATRAQDVLLMCAKEKGFWRGSAGLTNARAQAVEADLSLTALPEGGFIVMAQDTRERRNFEKETEDLRHQYYQAQKMESLGRLSGGIAHDFNNILAAIMGYAEFLTQDLKKGEPTHGFAEKILVATNRAKDLIEQILNFSRTNEQGRTDIVLDHSIAEVLSMVRASLPSTIALERCSSAPDVVINGNPTQISQALMNLCVNAQDAMDDKGTLEITLDVVDGDTLEIPSTSQIEEYPDDNRAAPVFMNAMGAGRTFMSVGHVIAGQKYARVCVTDTGTGISRDVMERMFEPFFTTKAVDKGTGLGLASVHGILIAHHGFLCIDTTLGIGTSFQMMFPLKSEGFVSDTQYVASKSQAVKSGKVLVVDDQDDVRATMCMALQRAGFEVYDSANALEALALIRDNRTLFHMVVSDFSMPGMTGADLAYKVSEFAPDLPFLIVSGYAEAETRDAIASVPAIRNVLRKPVGAATLENAVREIMAL